jgi:23S rRNA (uracil747-C5)-methyltransferase
MAEFCGYFKENICRSCGLLETDYEQQIALKEAVMAEAIGKVKIDPSVRSEVAGFRNKAKLVVSGTTNNPILGLIEKEILNCPVHDPVINRILTDLIPFIKHAKLVPYHIAERKGELKGIILFHGDETYIRFVLRSRESLDRIRKNLPELLASHPDIKSVSVNIQPIHQAILEGEEEIHLGPENFLTQSYGNIKLRIRPQAFVQTNQLVARKLYQTAAQWVKETRAKRFLELFSGQGAFSFHCAEFVTEATGIEINPEAVKMSQETASVLGLTHLHFLALDAGKSLELIRKKAPDIILVNPPRRGLAESIKILEDVLPEWIIYSSCSAASLKGDLDQLKNNYIIERARLFDMFPHTTHFETLVLLKRIQR